MAPTPEDVLEACWTPGEPSDAAGRTCRWCGQRRQDAHAGDCPAKALEMALMQRDALSEYIRAEKRIMILQGAVRLARKPAKEDVRRRLDEATLHLEASLRRLSELGIEDMVREHGSGAGAQG